MYESFQNANNYKYGDNAKFRSMSDKFNAVRLLAGGNDGKEWFNKLCNYYFILPVSIIMIE